MKKISLVLGMILAVALSLTSCKQPSDPELSADDYTTNTEWLLGKWKISYEADVSAPSYSGDVPEIGKKMFETIAEELKTVAAPKEVEITEANIEVYKAMLKASAEAKPQESPMEGMKIEGNTSSSINKDKTVVKFYADFTVSMSEGGASASLSASETTTWEKL